MHGRERGRKRGMKEGRMCTGGRVSEERGNGGGRYGGGEPEGQAGEEEKKGRIRKRHGWAEGQREKSGVRRGKTEGRKGGPGRAG